MPTVSKKQEKFMQAVANNPKFAKKVGVNQSIGQEFIKGKDMKKNYMYGGKVKKMNMGGATMGARGKTMADMKDMEGRAMAAGRLGGSPAMMADARGRAMKHGGAVMKAKGKKMNMGGPTARTKRIMNEKDEIRRVDKEIRKNEGYKDGGKVKAFKAHMMYDKKTGKGVKAPTMAKHLELKKKGYGHTKGKKMMMGGKVKGYKMGGKVSSASKRADGIAQRGRTRGRIV